MTERWMQLDEMPVIGHCDETNEYIDMYTK